ncbi:MAG: sigma 54-interacting transcriptional regulator, partial [Pseudomonadota bacterium]
AIAASDRDALIEGAPGTGTSKVAEVVHLLSARQAAAFRKRAAIALDPAALHTALAEADGTLFIDEIADLPAQSQIDLADALERTARPVVLAGTYRDLRQLAEDGTLNSDLYWRLSSQSVRIPALQERPEDIPVLFRHYVAMACEQGGLQPPEITPEHLAQLMANPWPGNARALMSEAMRFAVQGGPEEAAGLGLAEKLAQVEKSLLEDALRRFRGRAAQAAEALKLPRKTFYDRLAKHGVRPEDFRS